MTTAVEDLTAATQALMDAINASKTTLEAAAPAAAASAAAAAASAAQLGGANVETLAANKALTDANPTYQLLNPGGANRDVTLPASSASAGRGFSVKNTGTANFLTVKTSVGTALGVPVGAGYALTVVWSGTAWELLA